MTALFLIYGYKFPATWLEICDIRGTPGPEEAVGPQKSRSAYMRYLRGMSMFREPIEAAIRSAPWPAALGNWRPTLISGLIGQDLTDLGASVQQLNHLPNMVFDMERLLGTLYVPEGASLGARVLIEDVSLLGLHSAFGARHLAKQAGSLAGWRALLGALESLKEPDM